MDSEDYLQQINQSLKDLIKLLATQHAEINNKLADVKGYLSDIESKIDDIIQKEQQ